MGTDAKKPFVRVHKDVACQPKLSGNAKLLYSIIQALAEKHGHSFARQEYLAERLGRSSRSVRRYINELLASEMIEIKRNGLGEPNHYILSYPERTGVSYPERTGVSYPERTGVSYPERTGVSGPERTGVSGPINGEEQHEKNSSSAAAVFSNETTEGQLLETLLAHGFTKRHAARLLARDRGLVAAALRYVDVRAAKKDETPIGKRGKFLRWVLSHADEVLERCDGQWIAPTIAAPEPPPYLRREQEQAAARLENKSREQAERERWDRLRPQLDALSEGERADIWLTCQRNLPFLVGRNRDEFGSISACLTELEHRLGER